MEIDAERFRGDNHLSCRRGGVEEMEAPGDPYGKARMDDVQPPAMRGDGQDIPGGDPALPAGDFLFGKEVTAAGGQPPLDIADLLPDGVVSRRRIKLPVPRHEIDQLSGRPSSQGGRYFLEQSGCFVILQPVAEVVEPGGIAGDDSVTVSKSPKEGKKGTDVIFSVYILAGGSDDVSPAFPAPTAENGGTGITAAVRRCR